MSSIHAARMTRFLDADLYVVTSQEVSVGRDTLAIIRAVLAGGGRLIQVREKGLSNDALTTLAEEARRLTADANALLIINDHVDIALAIGADGVHLGQEDLPIAEARVMAPDLIIGASSHSVTEFREAREQGASYINIGPVFPTKTKKVAGSFLGLEGVEEISRTAEVPFTVMGGIKKEHIPALVEKGAAAIAVVTAVTAAEDPERSTRELLAEIRGRRELVD